MLLLITGEAQCRLVKFTDTAIPNQLWGEHHKCPEAGLGHILCFSLPLNAAAAAGEGSYFICPKRSGAEMPICNKEWRPSGSQLSAAASSLSCSVQITCENKGKMQGEGEGQRTRQSHIYFPFLPIQVLRKHDMSIYKVSCSR